MSIYCPNSGFEHQFLIPKSHIIALLYRNYYYFNLHIYNINSELASPSITSDVTVVMHPTKAITSSDVHIWNNFIMNNAPIFQQQARTAENTPISTESQQNGEFNWYKVSTLALLKLEIADIAKINNNIINIYGLPLDEKLGVQHSVTLFMFCQIDTCLRLLDSCSVSCTIVKARIKPIATKHVAIISG